MSPDIVEWFKNIAPVATVVSAVAALLADRFRVFPARLGRYVFWYGALTSYTVWIFNLFMSHTAGRSWLITSWSELAALIALGVCSVAAVIFVIIHTGVYRLPRKVPNKQTVVRHNPGDHAAFGMLKPDATDEYIDGYWKLSDFAVLRKDRFVNSRTEAATTLRLVGGSVLLDTVLYNLSETSILLDELECVTKSHQLGTYKAGAGPGALPISGVYQIHAKIDNQRVSVPMEPRLHVPSNDVVRFMILFTANMTGCWNPKFSFRIIIKGGSRRLSELGRFRLSFDQLTQSVSETTALLERRSAIDPEDIPTLVRYGLALEEAGAKAAQEVFARVLELNPDNAEGLSFLIRSASTPEEARINLYYKLESLDAQSAASLNHYVVPLLMLRAEEVWRHSDLEALRGIIKEARRLAVKSRCDYWLKCVLEKEIMFAIYEGNLEVATDKARTWASTGDLFIVSVSSPDASIHAFVERLKEALSETWSAEIEEAIRDAIAQAADAA